jgi:PadR family transcriptional regulator PadR
VGKPSDLIQGTLDLLILKTVSLEPKHGWAIAKRIQQVSQDGLRAKSGQTETGREAKFYALTPAGKKQLARELESWDRLSGAIGLVVRDGEA